jgi:hypothetical protein
MVMSTSEHDTSNPFVNWVTLDEAAKRIGFNITTVAYWADQGYIKAFPIGNRIRVVNIEEVTAYAAERKKSRKYNKPRRKKLDTLQSKE